MPSTYSSNLRLELIASGEQANTWGNTTNTNLGTLLEQSITGNVQIDISSGNKVLTALNGAQDQARAMVIIAIGSAASGRTITAPANVAKVYILQNDSTADVTIKTAAAGTPLGVLVPAGTAKLVFTDGTDFFEASNAADVFMADTVTITGTPTAATDATTVGAVTAQLSGLASTYLPIAGGTMTGAIDMGSTNKITNLATPTISTDATTKAYVDAQISGGGIPAGTRIVFAQAAAPSGWTQVTTYNNYAMRVVSGTGAGTGGSVGFTTAFASQPVTGSVSLSGLSVSGSVQGATLSQSQMPSHVHGLQYNIMVTNLANVAWVQGAYMQGINFDTYPTGGGGSHSHGFSGSVSGTASFSGNSINMAVQYLDVIVCSKN